MSPDDDWTDDVVPDRIRDAARSLTPADHHRIAPPADLWDRIDAAIDAPTHAPVEVPVEQGPQVIGEERADDERVAPVVALPQRARGRWLLAAAAVIVIIAAVAVVVTRPPETRLVSTAALTPLEGTATAEARLERTGDQRRLVVTVHDMPAAPDGHYYELWLMDRTITVPAALGRMTGSVTVPIAADVDTDALPVVDISVQADGEPEYSGHSILRGTLQ